MDTTFTFPQRAMPEPENELAVKGVDSDDDWRRRISIPINAAILDQLKVGDECTIVLTGVVKGLSSNEDESSGEQNLQLSVDSITLKDEYDIAQEGFSRGFSRGAGMGRY